VNLFISYTSEDSAVAIHLKNDLSRAGVSPWCYELEGEVGEDFLREADEKIRSADVFCLLDSAAARNSTWVRHECKVAHAVMQERGKPRMVVCLLQKEGPWREEQLFERHNYVRYINLTSYDNGLGSLCAFLGIDKPATLKLPRGPDFSEELTHEKIKAKDRYDLLDQYERFCECMDAARDTAEAILRALMHRCRELGARTISPSLALAVMYGDTGRHAEAKALLDDAVQNRPDDPRGWAGLGACAYTLGQYGQAVKSLKRAHQLIEQTKNVRHREQRASVINNLVVALMAHNRPEEALQLLERASDSDYESVPGLRALHGKLLYEEGKAKRGIQELEKAVSDQNQLSVRPFVWLAEAYEDQGQNSIPVLQRGAELFPEEPEVLRKLAAARQRLEDCDGAINLMRKAILLEDSIEHRADLALIYHSCRRPEERNSMAWSCLDKLPGTPSERYFRGLALHLSGAKRVAALDLKKCREEDERIRDWPEYDELIQQ
jgi:tetratricopeptide (TPR) repeat protein